MKKHRLIVIIPLLLSMSFTLPPAELTTAERKLAVNYLTKTKEELLKSIKGLTREQLAFKSSADSWSVAECVEHLAISETNLFGLLQGTLKEEANPSKRTEVKITDEGLFHAISDRSYKVQTKEEFKPAGKFGTYDATLKEFNTKRDATITYVETTSDDLRNHFFTFPVAALGTVDTYQLLLFIAGHTKRHTLQIEEVKANTAFPK
jgi:hypothetical protein